MIGRPSRDEVFRTLADPIRWRIVTLFGAGDELACGVLHRELPVAKPTISYHAGILARIGLITARRRGRHVTYTLRREVLGEVLSDLATLLPGGSATRPAAGPLPTW